MSRFIKYASNLLDGVDNIAKDSLIDQGTDFVLLRHSTVEKHNDNRENTSLLYQV